ncbi:MAG: hypothetical protein KAT75_07250, partial [Dehalococcoidia bacterium]|nr:hypothetical protein [Dehalococcoidia bacterium]
RWLIDKLEASAAMAIFQDTDGKALIRWVYCEGLTLKQVNAIIGLSESTIRDRINRAFDDLIESMPYEMARRLVSIENMR